MMSEPAASVHPVWVLCSLSFVVCSETKTLSKDFCESIASISDQILFKIQLYKSLTS